MRKKRDKASVGKTFVENISIFGLNARMAPLGLQMYAADFLAAAKAIQQPNVPPYLACQPPNVPFAPARPYLACHALELALKAFLSLKEYSLDELADSKFRHNLVNLLDEAERNGLREFVKLEEDETFQIRRASNYYSEKVFEYPAIGEAPLGYFGSPDTNILINAAEALVGVLREPCLEGAQSG